MPGPLFVGQYRSVTTTFLNAGALNQPIYKAGPNGSRIHGISASQDDTATSLIKFYKATVLTDNRLAYPGAPDTLGKGPILALTKAATDTATRTNGSFVSDGWLVGNLACIINSSDNLQNQILSYITAVAAGTLSFNGTPMNASAATPATDLQICSCFLLWSKALVNGAGNADATPALNMLSTTNYPGLYASPDTFLTLGPNQILIANIAAAPASAKNVSIVVDAGDY